MKKKQQTILVTGGCGYVGSVLVPKLVRSGYKVKVFDKLIFGSEDLQRALGSYKEQVEIIQGDVYTFDPFVLKGIDAVIHLAGLSNDPTAEFNPKANFSINVEGTKRVADACVYMDVERFIFASSCSIYYSLSPYTGLLNEQSEISPVAPYSLSKKLAEEYLLSLKSDKFHPTFLRKGTIFGWSPRMRYDLVVNVFTRDAWNKGRLTVHNGGEMWRPLLSINDACEAYMKVLSAPVEKVSGQAFNLLHKNYRIIELAHWLKYILREYKQIEVDVQYNSSVAPRSYQVSNDKYQDTFGYIPSTGISSEVLNIWNRVSEGITADFNNPKYYNIQWFTQLLEVSNLLKQIGPIFPEENKE